MKKTIVGLLGVAAVLGLALAATRMGRKLRAHVTEMAAQCREMAVGRNGDRVARSENETEETGTTEAVAPSA